VTYTPHNTPIANPSDHNSYSKRTLYRFQFGAYGTDYVYAWACHTLDDALEAAAEWLEEHKPGHFSEPDYDDSARELGAPDDWRTDEEWAGKVAEHAETDHTYTESGYLLSWEWTVDEVHDADEWGYVVVRSMMESDDDCEIDADKFASLTARYRSEE
jgi:hypothetical protein